MKLASCTTRDTWKQKKANPGASALIYSEKCILLFNLVFWTEISLELGKRLDTLNPIISLTLNVPQVSKDTTLCPVAGSNDMLTV